MRRSFGRTSRDGARCIALLAVWVCAGAAAEARAATACKAKMRSTTGQIEVSATVASDPAWGTARGAATHAFADVETCAGTGRITHCTLGASGTLAGRTPPASCEIVVSDASGVECVALIRGCTPGLRRTDGSFAADDPRRADALSDDHLALLAVWSLQDGGATVRLTGKNLQIVDGSGDTDGPTNGLGNLIVGYNEASGSFGATRTGSHNVVVGPRHNYASYAGLIGGYSDSSLAPFTFVVGSFNKASGSSASVLGGSSNTASGSSATVVGGNSNTAGGSEAAVTGGVLNTASGNDSVVTGGLANGARGYLTWVGAGAENEATGQQSAIVTGDGNANASLNGVIVGGSGNTLPGSGAFLVLVGGESNTLGGNYSVFLGGNGGSASGDHLVAP